MVPSQRDVSVELVGEVVVVTFLCEKILSNEFIDRVGIQLYGLTDDLKAKKVLIDLSGVNYLSANFLGKLITLHRKLQLLGSHLNVCGLTHNVHEVFEICKLDKHFVIHKDKTNALAHF